MGTRPSPVARPLTVRTLPPTLAADEGSRRVSLEWLSRTRVGVERLDATPPARPLSAASREAAALRAQADRDGFVFLPGLLPAARLAPLHARVDAALAARGWRVDGKSDPALGLGRWDDARWLAFLAELQPSAAYRDLAVAPELVEVMHAILGAAPTLHVGDVCRLVSPGAPELTTPPHQDAAYLADASEVWTAWLPLGPCPLALGPLALLAGSHADGLRPHAPSSCEGGGVVATAVAGDAPWVSGDLAAGDVLLFSALTVHAALPNVTADQLRVSMTYRYRPAG
jgi:hypothetical protein